MGIHNREYYRDDEPRGPMQPSSGFRQDGWAVKWIIGVCVATYFLQSATGQVVNGQLQRGVTDLFSLHLAGLRDLQLWRIFTYGICHGYVGHLFFNMFGIFVFGRMLESGYGSKETLAFFASSVAISGLVQLAVSPQAPVIGASGGAYALMALAAMNFPRTPMQLLFIPIPIELRWMAIGFGVYGLVQGGNIAHAAHLGGAAVGVLYFLSGIRLLPGGRNQFSSQSQSRFSIASLISKLVPKRKPNPKRAPEVKLYEPPAEQLERDVDRLLDKINREGQDSLTKEEKEILVKASESYRNRV